MRRLLPFLFLCVLLFAQSSGPPIGFTPVGTSPAGNGCSNTSVNLLTPSGVIYTCQSGVYAVAPNGLPGGAAGGDLSGTYPNPSAVALNGTNLAALGTGIVKNTTGTGVPSVLTIPLTPANGGVGAMTSAPFWLRFFGDGSGGAENCTTGTCVINDENWYSSFNVSVGATVAISAGFDPLVIRSTGACTIAGTVSVSPNTDSGGVGFGSGSTTGGGGSGGGGGGGAGAGSSGQAIFAKGGASGGSTSGGGGTNGSSQGAQYTRFMVSTGMPYISGGAGLLWGGSAGGAGGSSGGAGGKGAQLLVFVCNSISFTGTADASGGTGGASTGNSVGSGGGGGGGVVIMSTLSYTANTGTITVTGGSGGSCGAFTTCGVGGTGGTGFSAQYTIQ